MSDDVLSLGDVTLGGEQSDLTFSSSAIDGRWVWVAEPRNGVKFEDPPSTPPDDNDDDI
jgi:hypothetical protein